MTDLGDIVALLTNDPSDTAVAFDFDGTLAPIVRDPAAAAPADGAVALLDRLASAFAVVAVVSGRPRSFLEARFGQRVALAGLYGLETRIGGVAEDHPDAASWRAVIADVADDASTRRGWTADGVVVEPKGLSLTVHHRGVPHREDEIAAWAAGVARDTGLEPRPAKRSVELHPPIPVDKGTALEHLADGLGAVCYSGDDVGDLTAFSALRRFATEGRSTLAIAVGGSELPAEVAAAADIVLDAPEVLVEVLNRVATAVGA